MKTLLAILLIAFASVLNAAELQFTWDENDPSENVTKYVLYQEAPGADPVVWNPIAEVAKPPITLTSVIAGDYRFRLTAVNVANLESLPSEIVTATVPMLPAAPLNLTIEVRFNAAMSVEQ